MKQSLIWWTENIMSSFSEVHSDHSEPDFVLFTDASLTGWGCSCETGRTGGHWDYAEAQSNINVLEMKAALRSFAREKANIHVRLMMDNTTAVACVSKMGTSHSVQSNVVTKKIWQFSIKRNIWLSAAYIPGKTNTEANEEPRRENQDTEWVLNPDILSDALDRLDVKPETDLFASRLNHQFPRYISYKPDPDAEAVNAFTMSWSDVTFYAFPCFCIIPSVVQKNHQRQSKRDTAHPRLAQSAVVPNISMGTNAESCQQTWKQNTDCERHYVWLYVKYQEETQKLCFFSDS